MWLASGYFDESWDNEIEDRCFSMAGFYGSQLGALHLDFLWSDALKRWNFKYFKASQIEFGFGEFAQYRDDPSDLTAPLSDGEKKIIREVKTSFVDIICQICESRELIGVGATCLLRDLYLFQDREPDLAKRLPDVYTLCGDFMLMYVGLAMTLTNEEDCPKTPGLMHPIFDQQDEYGPRFKNGFSLFAQRNPRSAKFLKPPDFESEHAYRCIQAADLLAFEARKLLINIVYDPMRSPRIAMQRLREHVDKLYLLDYAALKLIAENQKNDSIPIVPTVDNRRSSKVRP